MTDAPSTHRFHRSKHNYLSYSQIADWLQCRYRWSLRYHRGLHPKVDARPLQLGDAVHECIEYGLKTERSPFETIFEWAQDREGQQDGQENADIHDIIHTAPRLAERVLNEIREMGWRPIKVNGKPSVEMDLVVPIRGFDGFICHIDFLAYDPSARVLRIVDFKTRRTFMPEASELTNLQHAIYHAVCRKLGIDVVGSVTYEIRNELPKHPKLNKNGTMSRTAIATDWETYRAALLDNGLDPADYADMEGKLADYKFTNRQHSYRSPEELDRIWETIVLPVAREISTERAMIKDNPEHEPIRNLKWMSCQTCQFRELCLQSLAGYDFAPILDTLFTEAE